MAHYDCTNCGDSFGISYGICTKCTPKSVFEAESRLNSAYHQAKIDWDSAVAEIRKEWIAKRTQLEREAYEAEYTKHRFTFIQNNN